jgi:hypothetical protein
MKLNRSTVTIIAAISLLVLAGCSSSEKQTAKTTEPSPTAETTEPKSTAVASGQPAAAEVTTTSNHGGQALEVNGYHLELVPVSDPGGIHIDLFLQDAESSKAISDAKVSAQIELPDGSRQSLEMTYDAAGEHYLVLVPSNEVGEYKVAVLSDIAGEKVNGRFTFSK